MVSTSTRRASQKKGFVFISEDPLAKQGADERKVIRSHVMRGKNTRQALARKEEQRIRESLDSGANELIVESTPNTFYSDQALGSAFPFLMTSAPSSATDFTFFRFCEDTDVEERTKLFAYFTSLQEATHPLEATCCFDAASMCLVKWLEIDAAYMHGILFVISSFFDFVHQRKPERRTNYHLYRMTKALVQRLNNHKTALEDSTVAVIMTLAMVAECSTDLALARTHMEGLRRIVHLRGGMSAFGHNPKLQEKIHRTDLGYAICSGADPFFSPGRSISFASFFNKYPSTPQQTIDFSRSRLAIRRLDACLGLVMEDLQNLTLWANSFTEFGSKTQPEAYRDLITSIQYRLLELKHLDEPFAELARLAFLAFMTSILMRLPGVRLQYPFLEVKFLSSLRYCEPVTPDEEYIYSWAIIMGATTILDVAAEPWLGQRMVSTMKKHLGTTWEEAQEPLKQFLWINCVHDRDFRTIATQCMEEADYEDFFATSALYT